jgi:hypothetical protein
MDKFTETKALTLWSICSIGKTYGSEEK